LALHKFVSYLFTTYPLTYLRGCKKVAVVVAVVVTGTLHTLSSTDDNSFSSCSFIPIGISAAVHQLSRKLTGERPSWTLDTRDSFTTLRCITFDTDTAEIFTENKQQNS